MIREGQKGHSKFLFKPVGQGRRGISWGKKYSGYGEGSIKENQGKGHSSVAMEMWFQGAGTSIRWEIRETDSDSDMLLEEETGFNPKGNWNYQKALNTCSFILRDFPIAQVVKNLPATQKIRVWPLGWEDPLEKEMATHCSILAWRMPWTGEPGRLQSVGSQRVGHDWETGTGIHSRGPTDKKLQSVMSTIKKVIRKKKEKGR